MQIGEISGLVCCGYGGRSVLPLWAQVASQALPVFRVLGSIYCSSSLPTWAMPLQPHHLVDLAVPAGQGCLLSACVPGPWGHCQAWLSLPMAQDTMSVPLPCHGELPLLLVSQPTARQCCSLTSWNHELSSNQTAVLLQSKKDFMSKMQCKA